MSDQVGPITSASAPTTVGASPATMSPTATTTTLITSPDLDTSSLLRDLFRGNPPGRVVVASAVSFETWEDRHLELIDNPVAGEALQVEGDLVAFAALPGARDGAVVDLHEPGITYPISCPRLMTRGNEVLALDECSSDGWSLVEVTSGEAREAPIPFQSLEDGEYLWFTERGGTVVTGRGDAEGNLFELTNADGEDLLGEGYASLSVLSTDGRHLAFVDHADPAAISHFWSPVVVVVAADSGEEVGRWTLDNPVLCLEFAETWVLACEADDAGALEPEQGALVAIDLATGEMNRVLTSLRVFLP